jgi:ferrous iron transport protein A
MVARPDRPHQVVEIRGGHGMRRHLTDMGFVPGATVTVTAGHGGSLIVKMLDTRIALGRGMAQKVMVRPLTSELS